MTTPHRTLLQQALECEARRRFDYNQTTGHLFWKNDAALNGKMAGLRAGSTYADGYRYIRLNGGRHLEHRIVWLLAYGALPSQIDHANMNRSDNRLCNLRAATNGENGMNKAAQSNNTTGFKGVTFHKGMGKFQAKISRNKKRTLLGYFSDPQSAHAAYTKAAGEIHGEFARTQ